MKDKIKRKDAENAKFLFYCLFKSLRSLRLCAFIIFLFLVLELVLGNLFLLDPGVAAGQR